MWLFDATFMLLMINSVCGIFPGIEELDLLVKRESFLIPELKALASGLNNEYVDK